MSKSSATIIFLGLAFSSLLAQVAVAFVASSSNYVLQSDSMNFGGSISSSTSYGMQDTFGELGTGYSSSTASELHAGYQQSESSSISITEGADITLSTVWGKVGDTDTNHPRSASGSTNFTVITNNSAGYTLKVRAGSSPAFTSGSNSFSDFSSVPAAWSVGLGDSAFGFAVSGGDALASLSGLWMGFSTSDRDIAVSTSPNYPSGAVTSVNVKTEVGLNKVQPLGNYSAQIIVTAVTN